ncbi:hypothetical protein O0L34_g13987 [Tuta absoluta]|nr:hypothetical protein O0L34_g13987 [Tuta absoluta]
MWHEARKQERMIRGMIVDYRRRAERRKDFYEKIKAEPTQFLQLHGRPCKIHLDPAVAAAGEGPAIMMPWQGDTNNMIDRFDVRAHLDYIPEVKFPDIPPDELSTEERQCNYERYRILAQNAFLGISEDKFLQQLAIEEQFGVTIEEKEAQKEKLNEKKGTGVAIGYNYNDPGAQPSSSNGPEVKKVEQKESKDSDDDSDLEIIDVDLSIDVNKMEASQAHELNAVGPLFGMAGVDLFSFLTGDADDAEHQKQLLREEKEKAMFSGRKSRRERRAHRDKKLAARVASPPHYACVSDAPRSPRSLSPARSASRSASPEPENIEFITSFGGEDEARPSSPPKTSYADKVKQNLKKMELYSEVARKPRVTRSSSSDRPPRPVMGPRWQSRSKSKSKSRSRRRSPSPNTKRRSRSISRERKSAVPRYYGRRAEDKSSSELSLDSDSSEAPAPPPPTISSNHKAAVGNKPNSYQNQLRLSGSSSKGRSSRETVSLKEKLKRKMQAQLARQLRADKRAEAERLQREERRQARRDEEMRDLAIKLRRKHREMRHQRRGHSSDDSDRSRSGSSTRQSPPPGTKRDSKSRSKSPSPAEKRIPVWETSRQSPPRAPKHPPLPPDPDHSHYDKRKYQNDGYQNQKYQDGHHEGNGQSYQNRFDRYPNRNFERHDNYNRPDYNNYENRWEDKRFSQGPDNRWEDKRFSQGPRRPYGHRGGYRGHGNRGGQGGSHHYGEGPSGPSWHNRDEENSSSGDNNSRVKLVDY